MKLNDTTNFVYFLRTLTTIIGFSSYDNKIVGKKRCTVLAKDRCLRNIISLWNQLYSGSSCCAASSEEQEGRNHAGSK